MDVRERIAGFIRALPVAHRAGIVAAGVAVVLMGVAFVTWITAPSFTVLYSGLDEASVAGVIDQLESESIPYQLENGGSTVMVPREQLYTTRATLAGEGIAGKTAPAGYELLDEQGLSVSDFRQRVDYRRALEGELSRTLVAMDGIAEASVHLVTPEEELFAERRQPVTASVLLRGGRPLSQTEVEAVTFLVASAVEGLEVNHITVADSQGTVLHAPGDAGGTSVVTNRNMRQTREFEESLAGDISRLLTGASDGNPASVVVRATLNYDESETETETFDGDSQVALREQTTTEEFEGTGDAPGGAVGVDGGPLPEAGESTYNREEQLREFGVDRTTARTVAAPGRVDKLSVAIVMDDGSLTGAAVPTVAEVQELVAAAVGLDAERGDTVAVTTVPLAARVDDVPVEPGMDLVDLVPRILGAVVLLIVAIALFLMTRRRQVVVEGVERTVEADDIPELEEVEHTSPLPQAVANPTAALQREVVDLVQHQPEEIAVLLRGWLADRRSE